MRYVEGNGASDFITELVLNVYKESLQVSVDAK